MFLFLRIGTVSILCQYKSVSPSLVASLFRMLYAYAEQNPSASVTYMVSGKAVILDQEVINQ